MSKPAMLSDLVKTDSPREVLKEILYVLKLVSPKFHVSRLKAAFQRALDLYEGRFPGFQACNTEYHDLRHTTDTILAMVRLIHGEEGKCTDKQIETALVSALFHDAGYILEIDDNEGTGAKYTADHVNRSIRFIDRLEAGIGMGKDDIRECQKMILCTDLSVDVKKISFSSDATRTLGKMLAVADLYAQMADRTYLEKLKHLYSEFKEGNIGDYESETDLLKKTVGFYEFIEKRVENDLGSVYRYFYPHFVERWGIRQDLYTRAIVNQKNYLIKVLNDEGVTDFSNRFKRRVIRTGKPENHDSGH